MRIGPKYKIARRLGAAVFEKTQTAKYNLSLSRRERSGKMPRRPKSDFGQALIEKQKARYTYGINERQFKGYVEKALKAPNPVNILFKLLESRLDSVLFRSGLAKTRLAARQIASHGHATVNGRRVTIPSLSLRIGDTVGLRGASAGSPLFAEATERMKILTAPSWLEVSPESLEAKVVGEPVYESGTQVFDLAVVIEFYNR